MRIQWYCTFSPVADVGGVAAEFGGDLAKVRRAAAVSAPPSQRTRIMKYLASSMSVFSSPVQVPS